MRENQGISFFGFYLPMILQADFSDATGESNRDKGPSDEFKADTDQLKHIKVLGSIWSCCH